MVTFRYQEVYGTISRGRGVEILHLWCLCMDLFLSQDLWLWEAAASQFGIHQQASLLFSIDGFFFFFFGHVLLLVGSWFPCQGSNPCPLPWKPGVLTDREFVHLLLNCVLPLPLTFYESSFFLCWKNPETCFTIIGIIFVVQLLSHVRFFVTPWAVACQASLSFTISQTLLRLMSIESVIPS